MPLVGVVWPNSPDFHIISSYWAYDASRPARSRCPGESVAAPKYLKPACFAYLSSKPEASGTEMTIKTEVRNVTRMLTGPVQAGSGDEERLKRNRSATGRRRRYLNVSARWRECVPKPMGNRYCIGNPVTVCMLLNVTLRPSLRT